MRVFLVAMAMSRNRFSRMGDSTTPANASDGFLKLFIALEIVRMGCLTASSIENLEVSFTSVGFPERLL